MVSVSAAVESPQAVNKPRTKASRSCCVRQAESARAAPRRERRVWAAAVNEIQILHKDIQIQHKEIKIRHKEFQIQRKIMGLIFKGLAENWVSSASWSPTHRAQAQRRRRKSNGGRGVRQQQPARASPGGRSFVASRLHHAANPPRRFAIDRHAAVAGGRSRTTRRAIRGSAGARRLAPLLGPSARPREIMTWPPLDRSEGTRFHEMHAAPSARSRPRTILGVGHPSSTRACVHEQARWRWWISSISRFDESDDRSRSDPQSHHEASPS